MASSKDMQRKQKISKGESCLGKVVVQPRGYSGAQRISMVQTKTSSCGKQYQILEEILARGNMINVLKRVETNKGAPGIDGMEAPHLRK